MYFSLVVLVVVVLVICLKIISRSFSSTGPLGYRKLPGPIGIPWLGPVHQLPRLGTWFKFHEWAQKYGPIFQVQLLGNTHVFISDHKIAAQFLGSRGAIYSGRPQIPTLYDSQSRLGTAEYLPLMAKNEYHSRHKKFNHLNLSAASRVAFHNHPSTEAARLLHQMLHSPADWRLHTEDMTARVICRLAWGTPDLAAGLRRDAWNLLVHISPAGFLSNLLPPLMHLPTWASPWKRAEQARHAAQKVWFQQNMTDVASRMAQGRANPSFARDYLTSAATGAPTAIKSQSEAAFAIGMLAVTAVYTVSHPLQTFILAATQHPYWLARVRAELNAVCGATRLPTPSDSPHLPTLRAFIVECLRWRPPIPGGIPHQLEGADDVFDGHRIPRDAIMHPLEYALTRDAELYPSPETFNPGRWLEPEFAGKTYREPATEWPRVEGFSAFGWGRRYCLGQELTAVELVVACGGLAWAFDLEACVLDEEDRLGVLDGNSGLNGEVPAEKMPTPTHWTSSLIIARPPSFPIRCRVRDQEHRAVVERAYAETLL